MRAFVVLDLVFVHTELRDRLGKTSPKWPILYRMGRKTTTQSINQAPLDVHDDTQEKEYMPNSTVFPDWAVWIVQLLSTRSDFKFSIGDSLESSKIQFTPPDVDVTRQNSFVELERAGALGEFLAANAGAQQQMRAMPRWRPT